MQNTFLKIHQNYAGALAYLIGPFTGLIFYIGEGVAGTNNKFVKFHALQSTIFFAIAAVIRFLLSIISFFGITVALFDIILFAAGVYLMLSAFSGKEFRVPIIGDICKEQANK